MFRKANCPAQAGPDHQQSTLATTWSFRFTKEGVRHNVYIFTISLPFTSLGEIASLKTALYWNKPLSQGQSKTNLSLLTLATVALPQMGAWHTVKTTRILPEDFFLPGLTG